MARRPEIPSRFGDWGLIRRLNVGNATFCKDWYSDVMNARVQDAERPSDMVRNVEAYVERNSGDDRALGAIVDELRNIGVSCRAEDLGVKANELDSAGQPITSAAKEAIRSLYRRELFTHVFYCVLTTETLLFRHERNVKVVTDDGGFEKTAARCGYIDASADFSTIFGGEDAILLLKELPLRRLTPAYDVVGMILADASLEQNTAVDGGLGLLLDHADDSMGLGMLSEEQRALSDFPVLMTPPQSGEGVYAVGPFG